MERSGSPDQLLDRLGELELRVLRLEQFEKSEAAESIKQTPMQTNKEGTAPEFWSSKTTDPTESDSAQAPAAAPGVGSVVSGVAKAVLGLAGAVLLHAGAESGWLPHSAGVFTAFAYAVAWLIAASRTTSRGPASALTYSLTSSLIFFGLVWESVVRSALLDVPTAALLIVVYLSAGEVVAWLHGRTEIGAATTATVVVLSLVLAVTTHNLVPFDVTLLCAAAASELAAFRGGRLVQRGMAALGADLAILITVWVSNSGSLPEGYAAAVRVNKNETHGVEV